MQLFNRGAIAALLLSAAAFGTASATTIDFEHPDAHGVVGGVHRLADTQGFSFSSNVDVVDIYQSPWSGTGPAHSGRFAGLNDYGGDAVLTADGGGTFSLQDLWFKPWFDQGVEGTGNISGYLKGQLVDSVNFFVIADWKDVVANFANVDRVVIGDNNFFLLDDITVNGSTDVPEPASLALLGAGFAGISLIRRRKTA